MRISSNGLLAASAVLFVAASSLMLIDAPKQDVGARAQTRKALRMHLARQAEGARIYSAKTIPPAPVYESEALARKAEDLWTEEVETTRRATADGTSERDGTTQSAAPVSASPLPPPRPVSLQPLRTSSRSGSEGILRPSRNVAKPDFTPGPEVGPQDNRNFFERIFGVQRRPPFEAIAYANLQESSRIEPRRRESAFAPGIAIYDIGARRLYLPNGDQLEAHSGLGEMMDDIRFPHVRMRGVTPPHVYNLTERERPFHGVRAIRLTPVGGTGAIFGRNGLLAHSFMLGGRGDSNGCVSIREYDRFLQAFLRGEIKQLKVVASL